MLQGLGAVFLLLILAGLAFQPDAPVWVAITFFVSCGAIVVGLVALLIHRYY